MATTDDLGDFTIEIADQVESFCVAVREIAMWLDQHELPATVILSAFSADAAIVLRRAMSDLLRPEVRAVAHQDDVDPVEVPQHDQPDRLRDGQ